MARFKCRDFAHRFLDMLNRFAGEVAERHGRRCGVVEFSLAPIPSGDRVQLPVEFAGLWISLGFEPEHRLKELPERAAAFAGLGQVVKVVRRTGRLKNCDVHYLPLQKITICYDAPRRPLEHCTARFPPPGLGDRLDDGGGCHEQVGCSIT
jgi:hypothetical protein